MVTVTDASGKTVLRQTVIGKEDINISRLPAGLYYIKNEVTGEVRKVMLEK